MGIKPNHKSQFPDLNLLDEESKRTKYETELAELSKLEQKKFSYVPPTKVNNFAGRRLFWNTKLESMGRILILIATLITIITSFILGKWGIVVTFEKILGKEIVVFGIAASDLISYGFLFITIVFSFLYILPTLLAKTAGSVKKWAVVYITFAVMYFIFLELACATLIVVNSIRIADNDGTINDIYPAIIITVLVTTIIQIIGSCFLIVKSDDIKQRMNLEI